MTGELEAQKLEPQPMTRRRARLRGDAWLRARLEHIMWERGAEETVGDLIETWRDCDGVLHEDEAFAEVMDITARLRIEPRAQEPEAE